MKKLLILFFILSYSLHSQYLSLFDIDTTSFPTMKAKFYAFDKDGKQLNPSINDLILTEDGNQRKITNISCPPKKLPVPISSVLVFDISGSMSDGPPRIESAKQAANSWIDGLLNPNSECALVSFSTYSYILHDFTKNRQTLKQTVSKLVPTDGTNYNQALLDPPVGGLNIAKDGFYKKVIIFLTDGMPNSEPKTNEIIQFAKANDITIFGITLDMPAPQCIKEMTNQTGGDYFENITTLAEAIETYRRLSMRVQVTEPCEIEWESNYVCQPGRTNVELEYSTIIGKSYYIKPSTSIIKLEFNPSYLRFQNPKMGINTQEVTVIAKNASFDILEIKSSNPLFDINPKQFTLNQNESKKLQVTYNAQDSSLNFAFLEFINNLCFQKLYVSAGWKGKNPKVPTLKLTSPNGGEKFIVGNDTLITWEGLMPEDTVVLDISKDTGKNWENITKSATGLIYNWQNIPKPASNECLIRVAQYESYQKFDPNNPIQIIWQKCLGGSSYDNANSIHQTIDGGFIIAGSTSSNDGDVSNYYGNVDIWVVKLNNKGMIEWDKNYGGFLIDDFPSILPTTDGGYIIAGQTSSNDGDATSNHGDDDYWIVKLTESGEIEWQKCLGGTSYELAYSIQQTNDDGYICSGLTKSNDGDVSGKYGVMNTDFWIVKLDNSGTIEWQKCLGGTSGEGVNSVLQTKDGGYIVGGSTSSNDGNVIGNHGSYDYWIVKLDDFGAIEWQKCYGGSGDDILYSIQQTNDSGYIVAGITKSNDGDVSGNHGDDMWVVKLDGLGAIEWQKCYGGSGDDIAHSIQQTNDSEYIVAGTTKSNDGDVSGNHGQYDCWILNLDYFGNIEWQKCFGGSSNDIAYSIQQTNDDGYIIAGYTESNDGDVTGNHGNNDFWVVKISDKIEYIQEDQSDAVFSIVEPIPDAENIDMGKVLVGAGKDSVVTNFTKNIGSYKFRVDSIYFTGADASAFSLVSGFPQYSIEPNSSHYGEFHFAPTEVRVYNANIVIITQSDTLTRTITGEGIKPVLYIITDFIDFGKVMLGNKKDSIFAPTIRNIGNSPLIITGTKHNFPNDYDFSTLKGGGNFTINPGDTAKLDLRFEPSEAGRTSGTLEFYYNGPGSPAVVNLYGEGIRKNPGILASAGVFQNLICDSMATVNLKLSNKEINPDIFNSLFIKEFNIKGLNYDEFSVNLSLPLEIEPDSSIIIPIIFKPKSDGLKTAIIEIKSNAEPDSILTISINAVKESTQYTISQAMIDFKLIKCNDKTSADVQITNTGTIPNTYFIIRTGNIEVAPNSLKLNPNESGKFTVNFNGSDVPVDISGLITITDSLCTKDKLLAVTGKVVSTNAGIFIGGYEAFPGEEIEIAIRSKDLNDLSLGTVIGLNTDLSFNPTILAPKDFNVSVIDANKAIINLTNLNPKVAVGDTLIKIKFIAGLGLVEDCDLDLLNLETIGGSANIEVTNGTFKLLGICKDGGTRLINPAGKAGIQSIAPNPAGNLIELEFSTSEIGFTEIAIYNTLGEKVLTAFSENISETGKRNIKLNAGEIESGTYMMIFKSPTVVDTNKIMIVK